MTSRKSRTQEIEPLLRQFLPPTSLITSSKDTSFCTAVFLNEREESTIYFTCHPSRVKLFDLRTTPNEIHVGDSPKLLTVGESNSIT